MTTRKFYKSTIILEVLHEESNALNSVTELGEIAAMICEGDCSGSWTIKKHKVLNGKQVALALQEQGSDPEFFQLDEHGEDIDDDPNNHN